MTVKEVIEKLSQYPEHYIVWIEDCGHEVYGITKIGDPNAPEVSIV